jgi:hypothetical protein
VIVREAGADLLLVTQPDHAALAARLMEHWQADGLPERPSRAAALLATEQHDIGWREVDEAPPVDPATGWPYDFVSAPAAVRQAVWRRAVRALAERSTYAAALVAQHALTIYRRYRGDPGWSAFFAEIEAARDHWFTTAVRPDGSAGGPEDPPPPDRLDFLQDYAVVATGDLLSLTFCNGWRAPQAAEGYAVLLEGACLTIRPDPFGGKVVSFSVPARRIPKQRYASDAALLSALRSAPIEPLLGEAVGAPPSDAA